MLPQKPTYAYQSTTLKNEINEFSLFDPADGAGGSSWYAPNGGTWTNTKTIDQSQFLRPAIITYVSYDDLVTVAGYKLEQGAMHIWLGILSDNGLTNKARDIIISHIFNTYGQTLLNKIMPLLSHMTLFYNFCQASIAFGDAIMINQAIQNKTGLAYSVGTNKLGQLYTAVDPWVGNIVYNAPGALGKFSSY